MKLKHYLIASEHNDYKPWIMTPMALGVFCLVIISLRLIIPTSITLAASTIDAYDLMKKINDQRTQRFITALNTNTKLNTAANAKAHDMIERSYFAHVDPDGDYVWPRILAAGYGPYITLGENLAMDFTSADSVVTAWMNSPTHRSNIVNEKFEDQGMASVSGNYEPNHETIMLVNLFGTISKTKSSTATAKPAPTPPPPVAKPTPIPALVISKDIKVSNTTLSGHTMVDIDVMITGESTLVTAQLKSQSISLIPGKTPGQYLGSFTFDLGEDLSQENLSVEARDKSGTKTNIEYPISIEASVTGSSEQSMIPVSNDAQIMKILRIIFGILATIYMGFLLIDAIILHRDKIKREGIHPNSHLLVFALLVAFTLFSNWF